MIALVLFLRKACLLCLILLSATVTFAQGSFELLDTMKIYRVDNNVEIFIDETDALSFTDILKPEIQAQFQLNTKNLSFGYLNKPIWLKVKSTTTTKPAGWVLEVPAPFLEYVDFYQENAKGEWEHLRSGYYVIQSIRKIPHTGHVFPLVFNDGTNTAYLKIYGDSPKSFPVFLLQKERWEQKVRWEDVAYGLFFGILIVMFFYNLFIYAALRDTNYLLYIGTIVCTFFMLSSAAGYASLFLWPEHPNLNFYFGRLSLPFLAVILTLFSLRFLQVKNYSRPMYYVLISIIPLAALALILVVTRTLSSAGNNLISISVVIFLTTGIVCRIKGNKAANFYIAAWTIYMTGGLMLTLRNSGFLVFNFWTTHFVEIGAAMETVIIALALADQYRRLRREKEAAQMLALRIQTEATEKLEAKVQERTLELHNLLEQNEAQTKVIESKNAELDSFFYRISHDLRGPISSLMGLSNIARLEVHDEQAKVYLEKQQQQVQRLNHIINGLIKLAKLNDGQLEKQKIDLESLIDGCIASFRELPKFNKVTIRKHIQPGVELYSEWTLLTAIFQNLIENSIKYSSDHSPFVNIDVSTEGSLVIIKIEDNGMGIHHEHQKKIFEMFYRASHQSNGSGLGLYILKRSVDRLQGTIELQSEDGKGSIFTIKLPV